MAVEKYSDSTYFIYEQENAAVISFRRGRDISEYRNPVNTIGTGDGGTEIVWWGKRNRLPQDREALIRNNNIVPALIGTKRDILVGQGLFLYKKEWDGDQYQIDPVEVPDQIKEWLEQNDIDEYLMKAAKNLMTHAQIWPEFIMNQAREKVLKLSCKECRHIRAEKQRANGKIANFYWSKDWIADTNHDNEITYTRLPNHDPSKKNTPGKFVMHLGDDLIYDDYYYEPAWWGGRTWIELANAIPEFHRSNLRHGYTIRYHIEIPEDYFMEDNIQHSKEDAMEKAKQKARQRREDFIDRVNKWFAGEQNTGRAMFTTYKWQAHMQKAYPGIKIDPVDVDMKDKALLDLFEKSNEANISAQAIHPSMAGIQTEGKLSSGAEIRNAFLMFLAIKAPVPRKILLKPLRFIHKLNGWPDDLHWGIRDIELTKLDQEKTGQREVAQAEGEEA